MNDPPLRRDIHASTSGDLGETEREGGIAKSDIATKRKFQHQLLDFPTDSVGQEYFNSLHPQKTNTAAEVLNHHGSIGDLTDLGESEEDARTRNQDLEKYLCSVPSTIATFTNYMFGATAFAMPYALACGGWSVHVATVCVCTVTLFTGQLLTTSITAYSKKALAEGLKPPTTYSSIVRRSLGSRAQTVLIITQYTSLFIWASGFILAMGQNMAQLVPGIPGNVWIIIFSAAVLPTAWVGGDYRLMAPLAYTGLCTLIICMLMVFWKCFDVSFHENLNQVDRDIVNPNKLFAATAMLVGAFSGHVMMPALRSGMKEPERFSIVLYCAYLILCVSFLSVGTIGYLAYGNDAKSIITLNFPSGSVFSIAVQTGFVVAMYSKVGLTLNPIAEGFEKRLNKWYPVAFAPRAGYNPLLDGSKAELPTVSGSNSVTRVRAVLTRSLLVALAMSAALVIPNFGFAQGVIGCCFAPITVVILPIGCYVNINRPLSMSAWVACAILIVMTVSISVAALYQLIQMQIT